MGHIEFCVTFVIGNSIKIQNPVFSENWIIREKFKIQFLVKIGFQTWKIQKSVFSENWISNMKKFKIGFLVRIGFQTWKIQHSILSENWISNMKNSKSSFKWKLVREGV